jgi:hypothetical protein
MRPSLTNNEGVMKIRFGWMLSLLAWGCASSSSGDGLPPQSRSITRTVVYTSEEFLTEGTRTSDVLDASPDDVFVVLPEVFGRLGIPVTHASPQTRSLGNSGFKTRRIDGKRMGSYLDCGVTNSGIIANLYDVTLSFSTQVSEAEGGRSALMTTVDAWARPRITTGDPVHCTSKQLLEERITQIAAELIG